MKRRYPFKVCVLIPAYNAEPTLAEVVQRAVQTGIPSGITIVDDGSGDTTAAVAEELDAVTLIRHPKNLGYGAAQLSLINSFLDDPSYDDDDIAVFLHSDGEMLPEEMGRLLAPFVYDVSVDCVTGSRSRRLARTMGLLPRGLERPLWKRGLDRALTQYLNLAFRLRLSTFFGGYRAIKRSALRRLPFSDFSATHHFDIEFLAFAASTLEMREVPVTNVENDAVSYYSSVVLLNDTLQFARRRDQILEARKTVRWW